MQTLKTTNLKVKQYAEANEKAETVMDYCLEKNTSQGVSCWPMFLLRTKRDQLPTANYASLGIFPRKDKWSLSG